MKLLSAFVTSAFLAPLFAAPTGLADRAIAILEANCGACHAAAAMSGLNLTTRALALQGGSKGPALAPGNAAASLLYKAVRHNGAVKMPPGRKLSEGDTETLREWIDAGAEWPSAQTKAAESKWWSFHKPVRPTVPPVDGAHTAVDAFVIRALRAQSLTPAPEADRATLIRRAYYDLHGLPPTASQVSAFVNDKSPTAFENLVETLLASPRYGEKWGRFWLDLVRYADTAGFEADPYTADAWRYRDYVIDSFNRDKPYDRFVKEQLAGDEIYPDDVNAHVGTGYYCIGPNRDINPEQAEVNREEVLMDWVDTTGAAFLGLTMGCARCHDHKFDPIPKRDYYRMQAVFTPMVKTRVALSFLPGLNWDTMQNRNEVKMQEMADRIEATQLRCKNSLTEAKLARLDAETRTAVETESARRTPRQEQLFRAVRNQIGVGQNEIRACMSPGETAGLAEVEKELVGMALGQKPKPYACSVTDVSREAPRTYMPLRGSAVGDVNGELVNAGFPGVLGGADAPAPPAEAKTTHRRKALAEWLANADHPLTARVMVNRVWQQHFGHGLAQLASDFGSRGQLPSHPELLDWLATEFVASGWSLKALHRTIMNTAVYRRGSGVSREVIARDPANQWLARFSRRRLNAEEIRDSVLQASGALNLEMGGRPVVPPQSKEELYNLTRNARDAWIVTGDATQHTRRTIYIISKRTFRMPMMDVFDLPESMVSCSRRDASTTAPQSLTLLNGSFATTESRRLGETLAREASDDSTLISSAWRGVLGRDPSAEEARAARTLLERQTKNLGSRAAAAAELSRGLFNLNEFLYVD
ncbi:MAG: PSD1 and planctomycete cytochrome C domain-containing protein [Bryobacteraceae bacterium]